MTPTVLTARQLRLALLHRQSLLERTRLPIPDLLDQVGGLQTQYAPSGYVGLWTRLAGFRREDLTAALESRTVIQATLLRSTIHLVSAGAFWRFALGVRDARRAWWLRLRKETTAAAAERDAGWLRTALADGPRDVRELGPGGAGFVGDLATWVDLVRVPPSGTWERRRADRLALAEQWVGPPDVPETEARTWLVTAYLGAFGPAAWADIASWAGVPMRDLRTATADLELVPFHDEAGRALVDLPGAHIPDPDVPVPVRFLPHWDANLLVHARRTQLLPEVHRPRVFSTRNPFSVGVVLVDGQVVAGWSMRDGRVAVDPFEPIPAGSRDAVEEERAALEAFHA